MINIIIIVSHHEVTRRAKEASDIWKVKMQSAEENIEEEKKTKLELTSGNKRLLTFIKINLWRGSGNLINSYFLMDIKVHLLILMYTSNWC